jgi:S-adenosylmethionine:tRNA ribosyltransferase-isomerase
VKLLCEGSLEAILDRIGHVPLPPYIDHEDNSYDKMRYQTVYAREAKSGSAAAPTAGLHFTSRLKDELLERDFGWEELTLYVGYGTFSPVRVSDIREHRMHAEHIEVDEATAENLARAKKEGRPIVAVGTTSVSPLCRRNRHLHPPGTPFPGG